MNLKIFNNKKTIPVSGIACLSVGLKEAAARGRKGRQWQTHDRLDACRRVGELDDERLEAVLVLLEVELGNGHLGLASLIEAHEADALAHARLAVAQYLGRDDCAERREHALEIGLAEVLVQTAHVQIGALDRVGAGSRERHLDHLVLQVHAVEAVYGLVGVLLAHIVDKCVAETLTFNKRRRRRRRRHPT